MLRGIDISAYQKGINLAAIDCDFVIVKATEGTKYNNEDFNRQADQTLETGKLLGIYQYAYGKHSPGTAQEEAQHFLEKFKPYIGKAIPMLDWEAEAQSLPVEWAKEWLDIVQQETGATPWFYGYASYLNGRDHSLISNYPLWMASCLYRYEHCGWVDDPVNIWNTGNWDSMICYQYSSTGHIDGWWGNLDLDVFYGDRNDWIRMQGGGYVDETRKENMIKIAIDIANDDSHGYSQKNRFPWEGSDFDCSSLMYWSAHEAGYDVPLSGYTGTMLADFTNAGFTAYRYDSVELERGDILLAHNNNRQHTEMYIGDGQTVGAHSSETGGIYGQPGDQTGNEISIAPNYGSWDYVLRPPIDYVSEVFDMIEALFYIDDNHNGYKKGDVVYWNPSAGFCFMEHPDSIALAKQCNKNIAEIHSSSKTPWIMRAHHITNPTIAKQTFGKRN